MKAELIEDAYRIFSKYHLNQKITGCYCEVCLSEEFNEFLHETPLRQITGFSLNCYISSVGIIDETCNDFKYFFPRMIEIIFKDAKVFDDSDFCIFVWNTLATIDFEKWEEIEKKFVVEFFQDYWNETKEINEPKLLNSSMEDIKKVFQKLSI
ncbi:MAG: hypothetical protein QM737_18450 [Ferruginibacter sp.]